MCSGPEKTGRFRNPNHNREITEKLTRGDIDFQRKMGDSIAMKTARLLILMLLTVTILPWGAFTAAFAATPPVAAAQFVTAPFERAAVQAVNPMKSTAKRKCRVANLPGSSCGPDVLLHFASMPYGTDGVYTAPWPPQHWFAQGRTPSPPREPPRRF